MLVAQNSLGPVCPVPLTVRGNLCGNQILRRVRAESLALKQSQVKFENPGSRAAMNLFRVDARLTWGQRDRACRVCGRETSAWLKAAAETRTFLPRTFLPIPYLPNLIQLPIDDLHERCRQVGAFREGRVQDVVRRRAGRP